MAEASTYDRKTELEIDQKISVMMSLNEQRRNGKYTDVTLECSNGKIDAHRNVLSACPYFEAMFSSGMLESKSRNVQFKSITANSMSIIVSFLYGSDVPQCDEIEESILREAIELADMISLKSLFEYLWSGLTENYLRKDNFIEMWNLAELHNQTQTFMKILHFVQENFDLLEKDLINLLSPSQMRFLMRKSEASDKLFKLVLDWGSVGTERTETLVYALNEFDMKKLSSLSVAIEYFLGKQYALDENTRRLVMARLNDIVVNKKPQLHVNVLSNRTSGGVQSIDRFCLREKRWLETEKMAVRIRENICWFPALSHNREIFYYGNNPANGDQLMCSPLDDRIAVCEDFVEADTYTDFARNSAISHRNVIYVWCGWYCVFEFDTFANTWAPLPPINYEYGKFDSCIGNLAVRRERLYFSVCALDISNTQMYELSEDRERWDLKTVKVKSYVPIRSKCYDNHNNCKLYFEWTKGSKFHLVTYDIVSEVWIEKQLPIAVRALFAECDQDFVVYQLVNSSVDLYIYYCATDKWEKLPLIPSLRLGGLASEEDCLVDVC